MKKLIALLLTLAMAVSLAACVNEATPTEPAADPAMTYAEFMDAETDAQVCVESYVQATQSWWYDDEVGHGKVTIYLQDAEGAYFAYEVNCTEEDAAKLVPGTKVRITGDKAVWSGEVEIMNGTLEFVEGGDTYIAEAKDVTALLGTEELEAEMNKLISIDGMTVKALSYKDSEWDPDIYLTLTKDGAEYEFCVENYLTGPDSEVYKAVAELVEGDVINLKGFLYWYEGPNTHITAIEKAA